MGFEEALYILLNNKLFLVAMDLSLIIGVMLAYNEYRVDKS